jgi:hypothetical protein
MDQIGTGEGAQVQGWGLYFAGRKEVGEWYRKTLSEDLFQYDGRTLPRFSPESEAAARLWYNKGNKESALAFVENTDDPEAIRAAIEQMEFEKLSEGGNLYTVRLNIEEDQLLDWDRPLADQPAPVLAALRAAFGDRIQQWDDTAGEWYQEQANPWGGPLTVDPRTMSEQLLAAGIRGLRYLDGDSRAQGEGTANFVIFSEADIEIAERYSHIVLWIEQQRADSGAGHHVGHGRSSWQLASGL